MHRLCRKSALISLLLGGLHPSVLCGSLRLGGLHGGIEQAHDRAHTPGAESNTPRATVAQVLAAVLEDPSTVGKALPFIGGPTPIAQALASAPNSNKLR